MTDTSRITKESITRLAKGAIEERIDYEMCKVVENILDLNTKPNAVRKITVTIALLPDEERQRIAVAAAVKSSLVPKKQINTTLYVDVDENGELVIAEMVPQIPGQLNFIDGTEAPQPKILKLVGGSGE